MAVTYGFYDSLNHDRLYNAQQMSAIFDGIINDGVFMSVGNQFHTVAGTGMQVIVKSGRAWFDSTWTLNDAEYPLSIDAADVLLTRIDAVVLEVNSEVATRANTIKVVKGTPASTPAKPTLTNTATIHQHALAYVTVAKNTTAITNSMIEIVVGKTETPYVTAILQTTDITDLYNQWEDYFQTWFDTVRGTLDGDVALNLQNQITSLRRETLKNTTPPIIGLPASATPDDMFQALAKTGELHVWRKTVVTTEPIPEQPAGYNLGSKTNFLIGTPSRSSREPYINVMYANTVSVSNDGTVNISGDSSSISGWNPSNGDSPNYLQMRGKFIKITQFVYLDAPRTVDMDTVYYIPNDATATLPNYGSASGEFRIEMQKVIGYPYTPAIPAGTTTTYPVSTNPNAYQEGSDAKPAGYVVGNVVTGKFGMGMRYASIVFEYSVASEISASDDGTISLKNPTTFTIGSSSGYPGVAGNVTAAIAGKYIQLTVMGSATSLMSGPFSSAPSSIVYIPPDTIATREDIEDGNTQTWYFIDRYQPVTGYAAIPAGTTIEYLGKLGDKTRMQVISYVGTGTYGSGHPNSLTFDNLPEAIIFLGKVDSSGSVYSFFYTQQETRVLYPKIIPNGRNDVNGYGFGYSIYGKRDGNTISWYSTQSQTAQANDAGYTFYYLVLS